MVEFSHIALWSCTFLSQEVFDFCSFSLSVTGLFLFDFDLLMASCMFLGMYLLSYPIHGLIFVHNNHSLPFLFLRLPIY